MISERDQELFLQKLASNIARQFGRNCEVAIHEFQGGTLVIKHIENGYITGRRAGDVSDSELFEEFVEKDFVRNPVYRMQTKSGRNLLASTTPIRAVDETKGYICINYDITELENVSKALDWVTGEHTCPNGSDVGQLLEYHLAACEQLIGKKPENMDRADKFRAVEYLENKHVFMITKSSTRVCEFLNLTKYALYNFLDEIRKNK